jgi:2'-5' RNA ligase
VTERLFFALWPGESQRSALASVQRELAKSPGRLVHPDDLHITIVFLGDLEADRRICAEEAADQVRAVPFALTLDRLGCFPRARILWCGASQRPRPLLDLLQCLNDGLSGCGFLPERRRFAPHVTLARKARSVPSMELARPIDWPVSEFALVIARPGERPRYRVVRKWPLVL